MNRKPKIIRSCKQRGWTIQPKALDRLDSMVGTGSGGGADDSSSSNHHHDWNDILETILDSLANVMNNNNNNNNKSNPPLRTVTNELLNIIVAEIEGTTTTSKSSSSTIPATALTSSSTRTATTTTTTANNRENRSIIIQQQQQQQQQPSVVRHKKHNTYRRNVFDTMEIVNAFDMPKLSYDLLRKQFKMDDNGVVTANNNDDDQQQQQQQQRWSLFGTAEDKIQMLAQRYALIQQRILRHPLFRPTIVSSHFSTKTNSGTTSTSSMNRSSSLRDVQHKLTPIECLLGGSSTGMNDTVLVLGMLIQIEEGQYYIEDLTGQVPVVFPDDLDSTGLFYVTELSILLIEGRYIDGLFYIDRIGQPLQETRSESIQAIQKQVTHRLLMDPTTKKINNDTTKPTTTTASFVIISDAYFDQPRVLQQLEVVLTRYETYDVEQIPCFIFMGNFCSPLSYLPRHQQQYYYGMASSSSSQSSDMHRTVTAIEEVLKLIETFPKLARYGHFCFIGGPNDYTVLGSAHLHVLPLPPLTSVMKRTLQTMTNSKKVTNVHYLSNPGRIVWKGKEIVLFRYDLLQRFQQNQLLFMQNHQGLLSSPPSKSPSPSKSQTGDDSLDLSMDLDKDNAEENHIRLPHCRLVKTILDQGHLLPVPNIPIYWNYDPALRLYPLPDILILGGDIASATPNHPHYEEWYGGCHVIHPGAFTNNSNNNTTTTTTTSTKNNDTISSSSYAFVTIDTSIKPQPSSLTQNDDEEAIFGSSSVEFCTI